MIYYIQTGFYANEKTDPYNITIKFRAPIDTTDDDTASHEINYEGFRVDDELKLLKEQAWEKYSYN